ARGGKRRQREMVPVVQKMHSRRGQCKADARGCGGALFFARVRRCWGPDELWTQYPQRLSTGGDLCRSLCKLHGGKSTGPRTPEGLERSRRANWKHGHFSREAKAERSRLRAAILALRDLCNSISGLIPRQCSPAIKDLAVPADG